ncbi:hypothetical protein L6164_013685 [Bauhinia variegata]|uniref:Uncharacterized protein n=1 Tax=Bauhinia variegata TaxID=167791 RepID=A0ACB9NFV6_BAUVA|nr:hypothetical protein L6164_013685 [Bauhinia variegata]
MRTLLVLLVASVMLMETLHAAAPGQDEKLKVIANRRLLSHTNSGPKAGAEATNAPGKGDESTQNKSSNNGNYQNNEDNDAYGIYGGGPSRDTSHHYFVKSPP